MACPTCDHTMQKLAEEPGVRYYWCPRCGTLKTHTLMPEFISVDKPLLVPRVCSLLTSLGDTDRMAARHYGVIESCSLPLSARPQEVANGT